MAITANTLPFILPRIAVPFDSSLCFGASAAAETITSTAYLGAPATIDVGYGSLMRGLWAIDITAMDQTTGDEAYTFYLMGSNNASWTNGDVEILQAQNFGGSTGRSVGTIVGATPALPTVGPAGSMEVFPMTNFKSRVVHRYIRCYVVIAGTTPSITVNSWLSFNYC